MKILVLNGSPKGQYSITLQTVRYLEKLNPQHEFTVLDVGMRIRSLEKDFSKAKEAIERADILLFSYPVYTFIAPYQLHRFIELLKEQQLDLSGKYATQITTSKHFYDVTAHRYIKDNCEDMGLKYIHGLSADMDDLLTQTGQKQAVAFFDYLIDCVENNRYEPKSFPDIAYTAKQVTVPQAVAKQKGKVKLVTNCTAEDQQLSDMIARFKAVLPYEIDIFNLNDFAFSGGCLGCFRCAVSGKCVHKDGFDDCLRNEIQTADAIVYAFTVKDHSMGASFKMYDDRQFCNGHRTVTMGMPIGYLVSGNYTAEQNLQTIIEGRAQVGSNFLAGIATDETDPNAAIDRVAANLDYALQNRYVPPQNFYGIGGMKIFRDLIWQMQGMMRADHKFYKKHKQYDFPQKKFGRMLLMYAVGALLANPKIVKKMGNKMNEGMLMPYQKLFEKMDKAK